MEATAIVRSLPQFFLFAKSVILWFLFSQSDSSIGKYNLFQNWRLLKPAKVKLTTFDLELKLRVTAVLQQLPFSAEQLFLLGYILQNSMQSCEFKY
jgi:hypothetical protein